MSKSLGNVIDPFELVEKYGTDAVRYFFLREIPSTEDGDFSYEKFETRYNADLAGGLGNLVARALALTTKISNFQFPISKQFSNQEFQNLIEKTKTEVQQALGEFQFSVALDKIWEIIHFCDKYIEEKRPWEDSSGQKEIVGDLLLAISHIADLLQPFLPETAEKIGQQLKEGKGESLFPRISP